VKESTGIGKEASVEASREASIDTKRCDGHRHGKSHKLSRIGSTTTISWLQATNCRCNTNMACLCPCFLFTPVQESHVTDRN
jgi:hypothetical protein